MQQSLSLIERQNPAFIILLNKHNIKFKFMMTILVVTGKPITITFPQTLLSLAF